MLSKAMTYFPRVVLIVRGPALTFKILLCMLACSVFKFVSDIAYR